MSGRREWFSAAELAAMKLPDMPTDEKAVRSMAEKHNWADAARENVWWRWRGKRGGGAEYHYGVLPIAAQFKITTTFNVAVKPKEDPEQARREELHAWFERLPATKRDKARMRFDAVLALEDMIRNGKSIMTAQEFISHEIGVSFNTLGRWRATCAGQWQGDWLPLLAPHHPGRPGKTEITEAAWQHFLADYLRLERPTLSACWQRVADIANAEGWTWPTMSTVARRVRELPVTKVVYEREGTEALAVLHPPQKRDRGAFHALEAVNLDGHRWDVFVRWPDGTVGRPHSLVIQDLFSGRIMAWRTDRTLHKGLVRLAFGDMIKQFGVPGHCYMDNGRENAAKDITGRVPNRYRFKVRDEDPAGLLPQLGVQVHWTKPYSGQSKPIERAFRDFATTIAKHPAFAGAYVGNTPMAKPENYGSAAVDIETFERIIGQEIVKHNARPGRRSAMCRGTLSLDQAFFDSYRTKPITVATASQLHLCLLAAEAVRANKRDGAVEFAGNRYWTKEMSALLGQKLVVRFDPQALHGSVHLFRLDGNYVCEAPCIAPAGFADVDAARKHGQARAAWMKAQKALLDAEDRLSIRTVAALQAKHDAKQAQASGTPEANVVRPMFRTQGVNALQAEPDDEIDEGERLIVEFARMRREGRALSVVEDGDD